MGNATRYLRQLQLAPPDKLDVPITVVGAGAIGSAAVMALAKMGCSSVAVWDDDEVSDHNAPNQFLAWDGTKDIAKVDALQTLLEVMQAETIFERSRKFMEDDPPQRGIVIVATDNMESRKLVWDKHKDYIQCSWFIDARMGAEVLRLYTVNPCLPTHQEFYEGNLYTSEEAERLPCSAKSIIYSPMVAGALIARQVKRLCMDQPVPNEILFDLTSFGKLAYSDYMIPS